MTANLADYNATNLVYRWYTVEGATETEINGATSRTLVVNPEATTNYLVRVLQTTSECTAEGNVTIKVITLDDLTLTLTPGDHLCAGGQVNLSVDSIGEGTYVWYKNGVRIEGADQNVLTDSPSR